MIEPRTKFCMECGRVEDTRGGFCMSCAMGSRLPTILGRIRLFLNRKKVAAWRGERFEP